MQQGPLVSVFYVLLPYGRADQDHLLLHKALHKASSASMQDSSYSGSLALALALKLSVRACKGAGLVGLSFVLQSIILTKYPIILLLCLSF